VNTDTNKYKFVSHQRYAGQNENLQVANKFFEFVSEFKDFGRP